MRSHYFKSPHSITYFILLASFFIATESVAQIGRLALSPLQKVEQKIAKTDITISYCRPSARGRKIFGGLVEYDKYWRTGANRNSTIEFSEDVIIGDSLVAKGKYSIITLPAQKQWQFLLYAEVTNWDVPELIDEKKVAARMVVNPNPLDKHVENLMIGIDYFDNYTFDLSIRWEKTEVLIPVKLTTEKMMEEIISKQLSGPDYGDYYLAATYEFESGKQYQRGLEWINKAIELTEQVKWWDYRIKAYLLLGLTKNAEAKQIAGEGMKLAKEAKSEFAIREFESILAQVN